MESDEYWKGYNVGFEKLKSSISDNSYCKEEHAIMKNCIDDINWNYCPFCGVRLQGDKDKCEHRWCPIFYPKEGVERIECMKCHVIRDSPEKDNDQQQGDKDNE